MLIYHSYKSEQTFEPTSISVQHSKERTSAKSVLSKKKFAYLNSLGFKVKKVKKKLKNDE